MSRPRLPPVVMKEFFLRFMPTWPRRSCSPISTWWIRAIPRSRIWSHHALTMRWTWSVLRSRRDFYQAETGYDVTHFSIDWEAEQVLCPQGRISSSWTPVEDAGKSLIKVKFSQSDCKVCPARDLCTGTTRRSMTLHPKEQMLALFTARQREETAEWKRHLSPSGRH